MPGRGTPPASGASAATAGERQRLIDALDAAGEELALEVEGNAVAFTHLDRVYWPAEPSFGQAAVTKRDYLRYLVAAAPAMLPHLADRPLTLFRWPDGVAARRVLEKHWEIRLPAFVARTLIFSEAKGQPDQYLLCNNLASLLWLAQMGTLEFHLWHSRVRAGSDGPVASTDFARSTAALQRSIVNYPDYILFDLDPFVYAGTETRAKEPHLTTSGFDQARAVAKALKVLLDDMGLASLVKTSGKTGLHVVVPIRRTVPYQTARELARLVAQHLLLAHGDTITTEWAVERRAGKVFLDYGMNVRGKSMTAPYSPRGLAGAPVSMPIAWSELDDVYPTDFRIPTVLPRLARKRDAWHGWLGRKQAIEERLARIA